MQGLQPVNVTGAIIVVQLCLIIIISLGIVLNFEKMERSNKQRSYGATVLLAIFSLLAIAMSADFYAIWSPILGDVSLPTIARSNAFAWVFTIDIIVIIMLVIWTGGHVSKPFYGCIISNSSFGNFLARNSDQVLYLCSSCRILLFN